MRRYCKTLDVGATLPHLGVMKIHPGYCEAEMVDLANLPEWNEFDRINVMQVVVDDMESPNPNVLVGIHLKGVVKGDLLGFPGGGIDKQDICRTLGKTLLKAVFREDKEEAGLRPRHLRDKPELMAAVRVRRVKPNKRGKLEISRQLVYYMVAELADPETFDPSKLKGTEKSASMDGFQMMRLSRLRRLPHDVKGGILSTEALVLDELAEIFVRRARLKDARNGARASLSAGLTK